MKDLKSAKLIYLKAGLFLAVLIASVLVILVDHFNWKTVLLLALIVWSSARLYYFMFYVVEKYVDPEFKFSGIFAFLKHLMTKRR